MKTGKTTSFGKKGKKKCRSKAPEPKVDIQ